MNAQTQALIEELNENVVNPTVSFPGRHGGTFVIKELVYAYAMWISPKFHLKVIHAYEKGEKRPGKRHQSG
tara:strand:- start:372 stop:584 length:213 start_codon:yes stop_codon:yes gene_type:complete